MAKQIIVLGATGDIGKQALEILRFNYDYELVGVAFKSNYNLIEDELFYFDHLKCLAITSTSAADEFIKRHPSFSNAVFRGEDATKKLLSLFPKATVLNAISGNDGIVPTLLALKNNQDLLLANKESYVVGSSLMKERLKNYTGSIYPIDSEHVGLYKCLAEAKRLKEKPVQLLITASGGALRDVPLEDLSKQKKEDVLKHPTWKMSNKITIDCATLVNKGYEMIEASEMFSYPLENIRAKICRDSLIHAGVSTINEKTDERHFYYEYSPCSMKNAIAFSLSKGEKKIHQCNSDERERLQKEIDALEKIDERRYPLFYLTLSCFSKYGNEGMFYYNAVDTKAIQAFLDDDISYYEIKDALEYVYSHMPKIEKLNEKNLNEYISNSEKYASELLNKKSWRSK